MGPSAAAAASISAEEAARSSRDASAPTAGVAITKPLAEAERPVDPVAEVGLEAPEAGLEALEAVVTRTAPNAYGTVSGVCADARF